MYFLGLEGARPGTQRATLRRALLVSASLSAGFLAVFLVAGAISYNFTTWINENSKYATVVIGASLLVLGIAMLCGYKLPFVTPDMRTGDTTERTVRAMFVFGLAYAVASIGCTIGLFIATVFSTSAREGVAAGFGNVIAYGAGMALLVSALTIALAFANTSLLKVLRSGMPYVDRIAAAFVVLSGLYLLWYFYWVDLREDGDPITDWAQERQGQATQFLDDNWRAVAVVLVVVVGAAIAYVWFRPASGPDAEPHDGARRGGCAGRRFGPSLPESSRSEVVDRSGLRRELVTVIGMGDRRSGSASVP